jgi:hypothetical protein
MNMSAIVRHPEVLGAQRRASKDDGTQIGSCRFGHIKVSKSDLSDFGCASAGILRGSLRSHLRMTD